MVSKRSRPISIGKGAFGHEYWFVDTCLARRIVTHGPEGSESSQGRRIEDYFDRASYSRADSGFGQILKSAQVELGSNQEGLGLPQQGLGKTLFYGDTMCVSQV